MQLTYDDLAKSVEGGLADNGPCDLVTRVLTAATPFGRGLAATGEGASDVPAATGFLFDGVTVQTHKGRDNVTDQAQYEPNDAVTVLRKGRTWVKSETIITTVTDPVFLRHTLNGADVPGQFRTDADTANADQIADARWLTTTTAVNELALLEINLP